MTLTWGSIPHLPMRCILDHLSTDDAMAAMSTCRHWREEIRHYEGRKETLKLIVKEFEKNVFLTRIFKRYTRKLHIYFDCNDVELNEFLHFLLPQFFDTLDLQELLFIGPSYILINNLVPFIKLKRVGVESMVFKHINSLQKLAFYGCSSDRIHISDKPYTNRRVEFHSRKLKFCSLHTPGDTILSTSNQCLMLTATLTQIIVDYDHLLTPAIETLANLPNFRYLVLGIPSRAIPNLAPLNWESIVDTFMHTLQVTVVIIAVSYRQFPKIMQYALVDSMPLVSLKVLFCESLYTPLLSHVSRLYKATLAEVVWADCPCDSSDPYYRIVRPMRHPHPPNYAHVNPFVLMCWQCTHLRRLAIHGYWVWQYDILGFVRLRKSLEHLEISAIYNQEDKFNGPLKLSEEGAVRVLFFDSPLPVAPEFLREINGYTEFKWAPIPWNQLHPALRGICSPQLRCEYIVKETTLLPGVTS